MATKHQSAAIHLPDDIILEILSRLPTLHLHRCKCVSKQWLQSLVPSILVRRPTVAFFLNQYGGNKSSFFTFSDIGGPILDQHQESALSTFYDNPRVPYSPVLSVYNGAVLFLIQAKPPVTRSTYLRHESSQPIKYALHNPFTRKTSIIKISPFANGNSDRCFIYLAFDNRISSQHFKAVSMNRGSSHGHLYSSTTRKWKLLKSVDTKLSSWRMIDSYAYCLNGKAFKMVYNFNSQSGRSDGILAFDMNEECFSLIVSPMAELNRNYNHAQRSILGETAGRICYALYDSTSMSMRIWALSYANGPSRYSWDLRYNVKLHDRFSSSCRIYFNFHFHPIDDEVLFVTRFNLDIYLYNFKRSELRPATKLNTTNNWTDYQFFPYLALTA